VGVSAAARKFMTASGSATWLPASLSPEGVAQLRQENSDAARAGCSKVVRQLGVAITHELVGGVQCQWVRPRHMHGPEVVLFLYGGAFVCGCPDDDLSITAHLAETTGRRVCVPSYPLAPEHPFPAAMDDVARVYSALSLVGGGGVALVGESAGGNLAVSLTLDVLQSGDAAPLAVALLSPWVDLTHSGDSHTTLDGLDPTLSVTHFLAPAAAAYAGAQPTHAPAVSPLFAQVPPGFPPTLISSATRDLLLSDSVRLAAQLRASGAKVDLRVAEGLWHVFEWYADLPEAAESVRAVGEFVREYLPAASRPIAEAT
jgi:acetyl esterase/lipase